MAIAACLTLALIHLGIGRKLAARAGRAHLFLALGALAVASTGGFELALLKTETLERYRALMYGSQFSITLMFISLAGFIRYYFAGRRWMAMLVMSLSAGILVVNSIAPAHWRIRYADSIHPVETFGGAEFTFAQLTNGPLTVLEIITSTLLIVFVVEASLRAWRGGASPAGRDDWRRNRVLPWRHPHLRRLCGIPTFGNAVFFHFPLPRAHRRHGA